jgi:hypothetical protein
MRWKLVNIFLVYLFIDCFSWNNIKRKHEINLFWSFKWAYHFVLNFNVPCISNPKTFFHSKWTSISIASFQICLFAGTKSKWKSDLLKITRKKLFNNERAFQERAKHQFGINSTTNILKGITISKTIISNQCS